MNTKVPILSILFLIVLVPVSLVFAQTNPTDTIKATMQIGEYCGINITDTDLALPKTAPNFVSDEKSFTIVSTGNAKPDLFEYASDWKTPDETTTIMNGELSKFSFSSSFDYYDTISGTVFASNSTVDEIDPGVIMDADSTINIYWQVLVNLLPDQLNYYGDIVQTITIETVTCTAP